MISLFIYFYITEILGKLSPNLFNDIESSDAITDGKGDTYSRAVNGSDEVPNFSYLPGSATIEDGFVAKISGDKSSGQDDYYVSWTGSVWKEVVQPMYPGGQALDNYTFGSYALHASPAAPLAALKISRYKTIDSTTMPMQLFKAFGKVVLIFCINVPPKYTFSNCSPPQIPSTGIPRSNSLSGTFGDPFCLTVSGPPERMMPLGLKSFMELIELL